MKKPLKVLFTSLLLLMAACVFETDEIYLREITPVEPTIIFTLDKYDDTETILLTGPETFNFKINISPGAIEKIEVMLDERVILTTLGGNISFPFPTHLLKTGTYDFTVRFVATGGTGSLAERRGMEKIYMSRTWILEIQE